MSIIIQNISGDDFGDKVMNRYQVRINTKVIAEFDHMRPDGLAECLRKAADAIEQPGRVEIQNDKDYLNYILTIGL